VGALTIRNIDDEVKHALRKRAAEHGVSMEQEARDAIRRDLGLTARTRRKPSIEELDAVGKAPAEVFDLKAVSDEMWEEGLAWPPSSSIHQR
jgi:antitoxin FitA